MNAIRLMTAVRRETERFMRVPIQTLASPWISAVLYIFIFGSVIGERINFLEGISYIDFVLPGVLMLNLIQGAFGQSSSSLFFHKFTNTIQEILVTPLSYMEMVLGYVLGAIARAVVVGTGIYVLALLFTQASMAHFGLFLLFTIAVSVIFALIGLLVALWAKKFEHLTVLQTFVITPLIYFGGMFNSIDMLPPALRTAAQFNPFFYMVDGLRYSMIDYSESNLLLGAVGLTLAAIILFLVVTYLFRIGWRMRK